MCISFVVSVDVPIFGASCSLMILSNCFKLSSFLCETRIRVVKDDQESCSGHGKCCYDILASVDDDLVRFFHGSLVVILVIDDDLGCLFSRAFLLRILVYNDFVSCLFFRRFLAKNLLSMASVSYLVFHCLVVILIFPDENIRSSDL